MGYRLFTLYALFKLDNDPGHIKSARPLMDDFVKRASDVRDRIGNEMSPATHFKINCTIRGETDYTCILQRIVIVLHEPSCRFRATSSW